MRVDLRHAGDTDGPRSGGRNPGDWRRGRVASGRGGTITNGGDRHEVSGHALVEGVVAALEAGAYGGTGARRRPPAARARQPTASRSRFSGSANPAEEDRPDGVGAVPLANASEWRGSLGGGVEGGKHPDGTVPVEADLALAGSLGDAVEPYDPRYYGYGLFAAVWVVGRTFVGVVVLWIAAIRREVGGSIFVVPAGDRCVVGVGWHCLGVVADMRWWCGLWRAFHFLPTSLGEDAGEGGVDAPGVIGASDVGLWRGRGQLVSAGPALVGVVDAAAPFSAHEALAAAATGYGHGAVADVALLRVDVDPGGGLTDPT